MKSFDQQFMEECEHRGVHPADLTPAQVKAIGIKIRSTTEKVEAARQYSTSFYRVRVLGKSVPPLVEEARASECKTNKCGSFRWVKGNRPACISCVCSGKDLEMKWKDPEGECPKKIWLTYNGEPV